MRSLSATLAWLAIALAISATVYAYSAIFTLPQELPESLCPVSIRTGPSLEEFIDKANRSNPWYSTTAEQSMELPK